MSEHGFTLSEDDIERAFEQGHFALVFQPKVSLIDGSTLGHEAYIRWNHPGYGELPPALFLALAQRYQKMQALTRVVLTQAIDAAAAWRAAGRLWHVSVNVAASDIESGHVSRTLATLLPERHVNPSAIVIEIPEKAMTGSSSVARELDALAEIGVGRALDGGSGIQGIGDKLDARPFGEIKIGGRAIIEFAQRIEGAGIGIVAARLEAARALDLGATAVGAETEKALRSLRDMGFTAAQGNALSPALRLSQVRAVDASRVCKILGIREPREKPAPAPPAAPEKPVVLSAPPPKLIETQGGRSDLLDPRQIRPAAHQQPAAKKARPARPRPSRPGMFGRLFSR